MRGGNLTNKKINEIADFMYSSSSSRDVPFRLSITMGMCGGDLEKDDFILLLKMFRDKEPTKETFDEFLERITYA